MDPRLLAAVAAAGGVHGPPYAAPDKTDSSVAVFCVVHLADDELVGDVVLWGIDTRNRSAHVGMSLLPAFRGQGLGRGILQVLCRYGFQILGMHRLQVETLSDNAPMIATATGSASPWRGSHREAAWLEGRFVDETWLALLAPTWRP